MEDEDNLITFNFRTGPTENPTVGDCYYDNESNSLKVWYEGDWMIVEGQNTETEEDKLRKDLQEHGWLEEDIEVMVLLLL